jgi:mitochondrial fission protein ELM1
MQRTTADELLALSDGRAGNRRQAEALAQALAPGRWRHVTLAPGLGARLAAPRECAVAASLGAEFDALLATPPGVAVGCGRIAALATRRLKRAGSRVVQILDPRLSPRHWDWLLVPEHDRLRGDNVLTLLGSVHPVDDAWLDAARGEFAQLAALPAPRTAVLLGGNSRHARFDEMSFEVLATHLEAALAREGGSLLVSASRRTPPALRKALRHRYAETPGLTWLDERDGPNPYAGLLAIADRIVCSPDSVNMISEACATHAPVFVFDPARVRGRPRRFLDALLARGRIQPLDGMLAPFPVTPLREPARVAALLRQRLGDALPRA